MNLKRSENKFYEIYESEYLSRCVDAVATSSGIRFSDQTEDRINDGDKGGEIGWHSTTGGYLWIRLEMPERRYVSAVYVYERAIIMEKQSWYYLVTVGDDPDPKRNHLCQVKSTQDDMVHVWICNMRGRYVSAYSTGVMNG